MTDTNQLPEPELGYIQTDKSNQPAFSARQMREAMKHALQALAQVQGEPVTVAVDHFDNGPFEAYTDRIYPHVEIGTKLYTTTQPATQGGPVLFIHPDTFAMNNAHVGAWKPGHELTGYIPLYTHPAPGVRDAKRYEWLRQHQLLAKINFMPTPSGEDLDAAIDDAMLAAKEGTNGEIN